VDIRITAGLFQLWRPLVRQFHFGRQNDAAKSSSQTVGVVEGSVVVGGLGASVGGGGVGVGGGVSVGGTAVVGAGGGGPSFFFTFLLALFFFPFLFIFLGKISPRYMSWQIADKALIFHA
jgi:hypothetical protein